MRKLFATLTALVALLAAHLVTAAPAGATTMYNPEHVCATPKGGSTVNGTIITVWTCNGSALQEWDWNGSAIVHRASHKCLTPSGGSGANGTVLTLWTCNGDLSQGWAVTPKDVGYSWISSLNGGGCITPYGGSLANGAYLTLWSCNPYEYSSQNWWL
ncbi:ricin-type beta-trefoil lectin domain protein [Streptomyces sp. NPDC048629]|uniref:RICIN domain-containing protein n=1 Tax=Streptomyces sp. NPDC048629 TaxID=3154824 RepID=UPI00343C08A7